MHIFPLTFKWSWSSRRLFLTGFWHHWRICSELLSVELMIGVKHRTMMSVSLSSRCVRHYHLKSQNRKWTLGWGRQLRLFVQTLEISTLTLAWQTFLVEGWLSLWICFNYSNHLFQTLNLHKLAFWPLRCNTNSCKPWQIHYYIHSKSYFWPPEETEPHILSLFAPFLVATDSLPFSSEDFLCFVQKTKAKSRWCFFFPILNRI